MADISKTNSIPKKKLTQGAQANLNGKIFETLFLPIFEQKGYTIISQSEAKQKTKSQLPKKVVIKQAAYTTIYGHPGKTEMLIINGKRRIRVENKYQRVAGSVDEKFVFTLLNAIEAYPEKEIIIVVDGGGYKEGARQWLVEKVNSNWLNFKSRGKDIKILNMMEFVQWIADNC